MNKDFYFNGFVVKSLQENNPCTLGNYAGVGRYTNWPLEKCIDIESISLTREAEDRWFGYHDMRLLTIPDIDYISRYTNHCRELRIDTFCLQIDSLCPQTTSLDYRLPHKVLGYEYIDSDISTSIFIEDLSMDHIVVHDAFQPIRDRLNKYGLIKTIDDIDQYLKIRNRLIDLGYDMEEYYAPTIVRLSFVFQ